DHYLYTNNGAGSFTRGSKIFDTGDYGGGANYDFDGDGDQDYLSSFENRWGYTAAIYYNNGAGSFTERKWLPIRYYRYYGDDYSYAAGAPEYDPDIDNLENNITYYYNQSGYETSFDIHAKYQSAGEQTLCYTWDDSVSAGDCIPEQDSSQTTTAGGTAYEKCNVSVNNTADVSANITLVDACNDGAYWDGAGETETSDVYTEIACGNQSLIAPASGTTSYLFKWNESNTINLTEGGWADNGTCCQYEDYKQYRYENVSLNNTDPVAFTNVFWEVSPEGGYECITCNGTANIDSSGNTQVTAHTKDDCIISCSVNSDCPSTYFCNSTAKCELKKAQGETCDFSVTNTDNSSESNGVCSSTFCRDDYDDGNADGNCDSGEECWCADVGNCTHNGAIYANQSNAPDCNNNGSASEDAYSWLCSSGDWNTNNCGANNYCTGGTCTVCTTSHCIGYQSCRDGDPCCDTDTECGSNKTCVGENAGNTNCAYTYQCRSAETLALGTVMSTNYSHYAFWSGDSSSQGNCSDHAYLVPSNPDGDLCVRYATYDADGTVAALTVTTDHNTNAQGSSPASGGDVWNYNYIYNASDSASFHQFEIRVYDTGFGKIMYGYYISEAGATDGSSSTGCCNASTSCVDDWVLGSYGTSGTWGCYNTNTLRNTGGGDGADLEQCRNSIWYSQDADQTTCTNAGNNWLADGVGNYSDCCGDDTGEDFEQTEAGGRSCCYNSAVLADDGENSSVLCENG
ncbi:MAG: hypothetical protein KAU95_03190, partial [Candidatus Aenigmarchaeota archaeon]|nr:hypothetical protein [Candidatus Aenigmarchaeota archaeon]